MVTIIFIGSYYNDDNRYVEDEYISIAILNGNKMMTQYMNNPYDRAIIEENINWYIHLHNNLLDETNVRIKVKLQNSTGDAPSSEQMRPSEARTLYEVNSILAHNQTELLEINWMVQKIAVLDNTTHITSILINEQEINTDIYSNDQTPFRILFELWTYSDTYNEYIFGYETEHISYAPWAQIWFTVN